MNKKQILLGSPAGNAFAQTITCLLGCLACLGFLGFAQTGLAQENLRPTVPGEIQVAEITAHSARISWGESTDPEGGAVAYLVSVRKRLEGGAQAWALAQDTTATALIWDGLSAGATYDVRVQASDGQASSEPRIREGAFQTLEENPANQAPGTPGDIQVTDVSAGSARISWGASADPEGAPVVYAVSVRKRVEGVAQPWQDAREANVEGSVR